MISACTSPPVLKRASVYSARVDLSADLSGRAKELTGESLPDSLAAAVTLRKTEFLAGRHCAREALALAGARSPEAPGLEGRLPIWPDGYVGSITHKGGYVSAAAAKQRLLRGVGIDSEKLMVDADALKLRETIAPAGEREFLKSLAEADADRGHAAAGPGFLYTVLFSAKESLYKALFPSVRVFFGFMDAELTSVELPRAGELAEFGTFRIRLLRSLSADFARNWECEGRFSVNDGFIHTGIEIPA